MFCVNLSALNLMDETTGVLHVGSVRVTAWAAFLSLLANCPVTWALQLTKCLHPFKAIFFDALMVGRLLDVALKC